MLQEGSRGAMRDAMRDAMRGEAKYITIQ
jgi:hypothetical protein